MVCDVYQRKILHFNVKSIKDKTILVTIMMSKTIFMKIIVVTITALAPPCVVGWLGKASELRNWLSLSSGTSILTRLYRDEKEDGDDGDSAMMKG